MGKETTPQTGDLLNQKEITSAERKETDKYEAYGSANQLLLDMLSMWSPRRYA